MASKSWEAEVGTLRKVRHDLHLVHLLLVAYLHLFIHFHLCSSDIISQSGNPLLLTTAFLKLSPLTSQFHGLSFL
jgi:hypothetical protein